jgi:hypothetical protein
MFSELVDQLSVLPFKEINEVISSSLHKTKDGRGIKPFVDRRNKIQNDEIKKADETVGEICQDFYKKILMPQKKTEEERRQPARIQGRGRSTLSSVIMPQIENHSGRGVRDRGHFRISRGRGHGAALCTNNSGSYNLASVTRDCSSLDSSFSQDSLYLTAESLDSDCSCSNYIYTKQ